MILVVRVGDRPATPHQLPSTPTTKPHPPPEHEPRMPPTWREWYTKLCNGKPVSARTTRAGYHSCH